MRRLRSPKSYELMQYLQSKQHYIDLYDEMTVARCRRHEQWFEDTKNIKAPNGKGLKGKAREEFARFLCEYTLYFVKGKEYAAKEETVREWMERDEARDKLLEEAQAPQGISCLSCGMLTEANEKGLHEPDGKKDEEVFFIYDCPNKCLPRRVFWATGEEFKPRSTPCPKCGDLLEKTHKRSGNKVTTVSRCNSCGHKDTYTFHSSQKKEKPDKNYENDRNRFCMTEAEGQEYLDFERRMEGLKEILGKHKEREANKEVYQKVEKLQKLTIVELEKKLVASVKKAGYLKLKLDEPEIDRDVIVPFTVRDAQAGRSDLASSHDLRKAIKQTLRGTNWRLMTEGISYRLGILKGRLRGYEREEDLLKLVTKKR